jgi:hypothetical protein
VAALKSFEPTVAAVVVWVVICAPQIIKQQIAMSMQDLRRFVIVSLLFIKLFVNRYKAGRSSCVQLSFCLHFHQQLTPQPSQCETQPKMDIYAV